MNADDVRALVAAKYPGAMQSPLAQAFAGVVAKDEAERAIDGAKLHATATVASVRSDAFDHAVSCIEKCEAEGIEYDADTLSHNIESNFPELSLDECDAIAAEAVKRFA